MLRVHALLLSLAMLCLAPSVGATQVPAELKEAMRLRTDAVVQADVATWGRLTTEDFTVVLPNGTKLNKSERLAQMRTQKPLRRNPPQQEQIKHYGETYVRRFLGDNGWVLEVWTKEGGKWRVAEVQVTPAAK
jgi:hypothetical protein